MSLQKLHNHIIQSIVSGSTPIYSYQRAVEELVYNSIDAGASSIAIRVDIDQNTIQVIDNGNGISRPDFMLLGERYATSKFVDLSTLKSALYQYGYRGQSLASITEVSKSLKITSRHGIDGKTWLKSFVKGSDPNISEIVQRPSKGTTVDVKGFLFNHNIQKKTVNPTIEIHDIKKFLVKLALVHNNLSLSLRDDTQNEIIFKLHKNRDLYQTLFSLFGIQKAEVQEYKVEKNQYKVTAFIGKTNSETSYDWIFLNGRHISDSKLHNIINSGMKKVLNFNVAHKKVKSMNGFNRDNEQGENKLPNYFIFIQCPYYDYDIMINSKKTVVEFKNWNPINMLLDKLIKFYTGNLKLKEIKVDYARPVQQQPLQNKEEVEKIIKKILGSNKIPNFVTQIELQNGVKGKLVRRKPKKVAPKCSLSKVSKKKSNNSNANSENNHDNIIISMKISDNVVNSNKATKEDMPKPMKEKRKLLNNPHRNRNSNICRNREQNKKSIKKLKNISVNKDLFKLKMKKNLLNGVIKKFHDQTDSVSRKCNKLSNQVEKLLNCKDDHKKVTFIEETDKHCNIVEHIQNEAVVVNHKKHDKFGHVSDPKEPDIDICTFDNRVWKNKKTFTKSTYDLLQTMIKSQHHVNENKFEICSYPVQKSNERNAYNRNYDIESQTYKYTYSNVGPEIRALKTSVEDSTFPSHTGFLLTNPKEFDFYKLTYESHNYNKKSMTTDSHLTYFSKYSPKANNFHFITEKSRDNFIIPMEQDRFRNKIKCNRKNNYSKTPYSKLDDLRQIKKTDSVHKSVTIDFTESTIESNHPNIDKESHKITTYTIDNVTDNTEIFKVNSQINSTYTIISNSFYVLPDSFDESKKKLSPGKVIEEHAPEFSPDPNFDSQVIETLSIIIGNARDEASVIQSTQQNLIVEENIEPLEFCQTIMDSVESTRNVECRNRKNDSLFADDFSIESVLCDRNIYTYNQQNIFPDSFVYAANNIQNRDSRNHEAEKINDEIVYNTKALNYEQDKKCPNGIDLIQEADHFKFMNRLRFVPKGMSQMFQNCRIKTVCNYNLDEEYFEQNIYKNFINDVQTNAEVFQSEIQNVQAQTSKAIEKVNQKLIKDNSSLKFNAESLKSVTVLGQVDQKFIATTIESKSTNKQQTFLVLFDQHAVHERIRLENNLSDYLQQNQWKSLQLDLSLQLNKQDVLYLNNYKDKFTQLGLQWTVSNCDVSISAIPEAILGKNPRPVEVVIKTVKKLISEEINTIRTQKGCISLYPKAIMDLVFSEACRYAIKFGDKLSKSDCIELLKFLSKCKTPFQCAHGRPVMAVLMNWRSEPRCYKTNATKIEEFLQRKCHTVSNSKQ